jgi:hypothetical protein
MTEHPAARPAPRSPATRRYAAQLRDVSPRRVVRSVMVALAVAVLAWCLLAPSSATAAVPEAPSPSVIDGAQTSTVLPGI